MSTHAALSRRRRTRRAGAHGRKSLLAWVTGELGVFGCWGTRTRRGDPFQQITFVSVALGAASARDQLPHLGSAARADAARPHSRLKWGARRLGELVVQVEPSW